ncbi:MAG: hypothetical protein JO182_05815 [Acidobacteriaceae bacterium]|nr:hypothetical protein [Acidobacteriaceae bacterium]MBV9033991.1 hypothetical protein [Acidobacteriaceae bacterium]MBV9227631.1 hypothetical protein [Acidobacteriaceae bacterium]MBV9305749.1 hypothetical protein [Acidobacteriaceae bacterium]MBV9678509.1 hypothetical protein [Acidobacteriaceae bacterium]
MRFPTLLLAFALLLSGARAPIADRAFTGLQRITGNWQASIGTKGAIIRLNLRTISNDSAVVETFTTPNGRETLTIFHPDGNRLLATHYCAQGNQPRLALDPNSTSTEMTFRFLDATNLQSQEEAHLVRLVIKIKDDEHFEKTEAYVHRGVEEVTVYSFTRVRS